MMLEHIKECHLNKNSDTIEGNDWKDVSMDVMGQHIIVVYLSWHVTGIHFIIEQNQICQNLYH
jgi:hypothetical protein